MKSKTKSRGKNVFSKTVLNNLEQSLSLKYGNEKSTLIFEKASSILNNLLNNVNDKVNKVVRKHISDFILPGFACYKALKELGINSDEAFNFVSKEINKTAARMGNFMKKFKNVPFAFGLMRVLIKPIIKYGFPKEGWTVIWKENSSKRITFDMTSCLYCEELKKRNSIGLAMLSVKQTMFLTIHYLRKLYLSGQVNWLTEIKSVISALKKDDNN